VNLSHDRWRRLRSRVRELPLDASPGGAIPARTDVVELRSSLVAALQELPARQRSVLVLRYLLDLSEGETAATLDVSVSTVKSSASRALVRLRECAPELDPAWTPHAKEASS